MGASVDPCGPGPGGLGRESARAEAAELFDRGRMPVERICRGMLRDATEAEDAAQQTFLAAYRALLGGTRPREPDAWLASIARHECLQRIRARMRMPLVPVSVERADPAADVHREAVARAEAELLWREIGDLPGPQRDALVLRELGGRSYAEVAAELGVTTPAVESLLFRARERLRGRLRAALRALDLAGVASAASATAARLLGTDVAPRLAAPLAVKGALLTAGVAALGGGTVATVPAHPPPAARAAPAVAVHAARVAAPIVLAADDRAERTQRLQVEGARAAGPRTIVAVARSERSAHPARESAPASVPVATSAPVPAPAEPEPSEPAATESRDLRPTPVASPATEPRPAADEPRPDAVPTLAVAAPPSGDGPAPTTAADDPPSTSGHEGPSPSSGRGESSGDHGGSSDGRGDPAPSGPEGSSGSGHDGPEPEHDGSLSGEGGSPSVENGTDDATVTAGSDAPGGGDDSQSADGGSSGSGDASGDSGDSGSSADGGGSGSSDDGGGSGSSGGPGSSPGDDGGHGR